MHMNGVIHDMNMNSNTTTHRSANRDSMFINIIEGTAVLLLVVALYGLWFHPTRTCFLLTKGFAHLGHAEAQLSTGQRYMLGLGVSPNSTRAMEWFQRAANQGHVLASYNLALAHMQGYHSGIDRKTARALLKYAVGKGLPMAVEVWHSLIEE